MQLTFEPLLRYQKHVFLFVRSVFSHFFAGQGTANALAEGFSFPEDSEAEEDLDEEDSPCEDSDDTILQFLKSAGLLYTHSGESRWSVFISRSVTSSVEANDPVENGVMVSWEAKGPEDEELLSTREITGAGVREFDCKLTVSRIFVPSDRPLSTDTSEMKKCFVPADTPRWLLISVPYKMTVPHVFEKLPPVPANMLVHQ